MVAFFLKMVILYKTIKRVLYILVKFNFINMKYKREILTHLEALAKAEQYQSKMAKIAKKSYWKPQYHISAPANWINDPMDFVILMVNIMYFINIIHILANGVLCIGDM